MLHPFLLSWKMSLGSILHYWVWSGWKVKVLQSQSPIQERPAQKSHKAWKTLWGNSSSPWLDIGHWNIRYGILRSGDAAGWYCCWDTYLAISGLCKYSERLLTGGPGSVISLISLAANTAVAAAALVSGFSGITRGKVVKTAGTNASIVIVVCTRRRWDALHLYWLVANYSKWNKSMSMRVFMFLM